MSKAIHMMIRVLDEARSVKFYNRAFGLEIAQRLEFSGFTLIYLRNSDSDFEVELVVNNGQTEPYDLGSGYGHLAFSVDDLEVEHNRFVSEGLEPSPIKALHHNEAILARFFFVQDPDGYKIEILQRGGRYI